MDRAVIGWIWVAGQVAVFAALILLPGGDDWSTPGWLTTIGAVLFIGGLVIIAVAALGLGSSLTPTPVPTKSGALTTSGFYRYVRHPIYTGVLAVVAGMTVRSGSWVQLIVAVVAIVFFDRKAAWEEQQLRERFPGYAEYAAVTPKFIPRPGGGPRST